MGPTQALGGGVVLAGGATIRPSPKFFFFSKLASWISPSFCHFLPTTHRPPKPQEDYQIWRSARSTPTRYVFAPCKRLVLRAHEADLLDSRQANPRTTAILAVAKANNVDLEVVEADTVSPSADFVKANPLAKVPTFVGSDGYVLTESMAIAIYGTSPHHHL